MTVLSRRHLVVSGLAAAGASVSGSAATATPVVLTAAPVMAVTAASMSHEARHRPVRIIRHLSQPRVRPLCLSDLIPE